MGSTKNIQDKCSIIALSGFGKMNLWYIKKTDLKDRGTVELVVYFVSGLG